MKNYQRITNYACAECDNNMIYYDEHHDMMFCPVCGIVVYQSGILFSNCVKINVSAKKKKITPKKK